MAVNTSFKTNTSSNYKTFLDDLVTFITNDQLATVAINAGGTGYAVGDIIELDIGSGAVTGGIKATFRVLTLSGSAIATLEVWNAGSYSTNTGLTAQTTTFLTGAGTGATVDVTYQTAWTAPRAIVDEGVVNAVLVAAGTGYIATEIVSITGAGTDATITVDTVGGGGEILTFTLTTNGSYTVPPTSPAATTSSASGIDATFTVTLSGEQGEQEVLLKGIGSGSDEIFVGIRTYINVGESANNWELAGMTGHSLISPYILQPNLSPGRHDETNVGGAFVPLATTTITWWINVTGRRILAVAKMSTTYSSMYLGFISPRATTTELPYPLLVGGCVSQPDTRFSSTRLGFTSVCFPVGKTLVSSVVDPGDLEAGPLLFRDGSGNWVSFMNAHESNSSTTSSSVFRFRNLSPPGESDQNASLADGNDSWIPVSLGQNLTWGGLADLATVGGILNFELHPTPDTGGDLVPTLPQTLLQVGNGSGFDIPDIVYGDLEGLKWTSLFGTTLVAEDTITFNGITHRIFQSATKTESDQFFVMEER